MTDKTALRQLIEAVEAGEMWKLSTFSMTQAMEWPINDPMVTVLEKANEGYLDAAKALHEALLPGWALERLNMWPGENGTCSASLWGTHEEKGERWHNHKDGRVSSESSTPARSWLIAILKAYETQ